MDFEFDANKSAANKAKHGIDFAEAQAVWLDDMRIEIPARTDDEARFLVIGVIARQALVRRHHLSRGSSPDHFCPTVPAGGDCDL